MFHKHNVIASEAKQSSPSPRRVVWLDCFVASLLAMTTVGGVFFACGSSAASVELNPDADAALKAYAQGILQYDRAKLSSLLCPPGVESPPMVAETFFSTMDDLHSDGRKAMSDSIFSMKFDPSRSTDNRQAFAMTFPQPQPDVITVWVERSGNSWCIYEP